MLLPIKVHIYVLNDNWYLKSMAVILPLLLVFSPGAHLSIPKPLVGIEKRERSQSMEGNANKRHRMDSFDPDVSSTRKDPSPAAVVSKGDVSFESNTEFFSSKKVVSSITVPESGQLIQIFEKKIDSIYLFV